MDYNGKCHNEYHHITDKRKKKTESLAFIREQTLGLESDLSGGLHAPGACRILKEELSSARQSWRGKKAQRAGPRRPHQGLNCPPGANERSRKGH